MKRILVFYLLFFLTSCSKENDISNIPLPKITTPTEMYPTSTKTIAPGPYLNSEPLIWLSIRSVRSFFNDGIPVIKNGYLQYLSIPNESTVLWDYDWKTDAIAYSRDKEDTSSCKGIGTYDLIIYNYQDKSDTYIMNHVSNAKWSPVGYPGTNEHLLAVIVCRQQLVILSLESPEQRTIISENADPWFTWSPDGLWIAYVNDSKLIIVPSKGGPERIINNEIPWGLSLFDEDIWLTGHNIMILAGKPMLFVDIDSSESYTPSHYQGKPYDDYRANKFLWDDKTHKLIVFGMREGGDRIIYIYTLSEDLRMIIDEHKVESTYIINDNYPSTLVGWWITGESFIAEGTQIWSVNEDNHLLMSFPGK